MAKEKMKAKPSAKEKDPAKTKAPKKNTEKNTRFFGGRHVVITGLMVFLILVFLVLSTLVPPESVPEFLQGTHSTLLKGRNTLIAKTGSSVSRYENVIQVENPGTAPIQLYFTPSSKIIPGLCAFMDSAIDTLDVCVHHFELDSVAVSVMKAHNRGVKTRVVVDDASMDRDVIRRMEELGIRVRHDGNASVMNNRFVVVDNVRVWTGSFDFTESSASRDDNNVLAVNSPVLANAYTAKFDEYWGGKYSSDALNTLENRKFFYGGTPVEVAFSPANRIQKTVLEELGHARRSIDIMASTLSSDEISAKLKELAKEGVTIRCLLDSSASATLFARDPELEKLGIQMRFSANRAGKMNNNVLILDDEFVMTGSYDFSLNSEKFNDENVIFMRSPELAKKYAEEFRRCWTGTKGY